MVKAEVCAVSWVTGRNYTIQDSTTSVKKQQPQEQTGLGFSSPFIQIISAYFTVLLIASTFLIWATNMVAEETNNCNNNNKGRSSSGDDGDSESGSTSNYKMVDSKVGQERGIKKEKNERQHKEGRKQVKLVQGGKHDRATWVSTESFIPASPPALTDLEVSSEDDQVRHVFCFFFFFFFFANVHNVGRQKTGGFSFVSNIGFGQQ